MGKGSTNDAPPDVLPGWDVLVSRRPEVDALKSAGVTDYKIEPQASGRMTCVLVSENAVGPPRVG